MRALKIAGGVVAAIVIVVALLLIIGIPSGFLNTTIADRVERDTGYRPTIAGSTRFRLWPSPNVSLNDVTLETPNDGDPGNRLTIGSIEADITLSSLWSGQLDVTDLVIKRPTLTIPLRRERRAAKPPSSAPSAGAASHPSAPRIGRITITDGTVIFANAHDHVDDRIESINARTTVLDDRRINLNGSARAGHHPVTFDVKAAAPNLPLERQNIPLEISINAPDLLQAQLATKAELRLNGTLVMINGISGSIGDGAFDGWASVDLASKPLVKLDLNFRRLDIAASTAPAASQNAAPSLVWSDRPIELVALNYVDAQVLLSAAELNIGPARFAPVSIQASLASGILTCTATNLGAYGGLANGSVTIDVSRDAPAYAARGELSGVQALPLLRGAADFDKLDGKLQATIDVRSTGQSQRAIMAGLNGSVVANFKDGAIRGLNVAQMIRSLTTSPLQGWQQNAEQTTDLSQLSASFQIEKGRANTADLNLIGPLVKMTGSGTIDLGAKTLALRVDPKLVMTTEGQGRTSDPIGLGLPVVIDGPWASPRIYPDITGVLDNPDAAYARLKEMGNGLFAPSGPTGNPASGNAPSKEGGSSLGETLGKLIQQGLNAAARKRGDPNSPAPPSTDPNRPDPNSGPAADILKQLFGR